MFCVMRIDRTRIVRLALVGVGLCFYCPLVSAQALNACDLNADRVVNVLDVQLAVNMALGLQPCTANIEGQGVCNGDVVSRVIVAALGGTCNTHYVSLNWTASTSGNITGYNVYRGNTTSGPYTLVNTSLITGTSYTDPAVVAGQTYYYVTTAVNSSNTESSYSNVAVAAVPTP